MVNQIIKPGRIVQKITIEVDEHGQSKFMGQQFSILGEVGPLDALIAAKILSQLTATLVNSLGVRRGPDAAEKTV